MSRSLALLLLLLLLVPVSGRQDYALPDLPHREDTRTQRNNEQLPEGTLARLGTHRLRNGGPSTSVAFDPDGKSVACVVYREVHRWSLADGTELQPPTPNQHLRSVDFSPDGRRLIAESFDDAILIL